MTKRRVIVELAYTKDLAESAFSTLPPAEKALDIGLVPKVAGCSYDTLFPPTHLPGLTARAADHVPYESGKGFDLTLEPQNSTYVVRAEIDEGRIDDLMSAKNVVGVYADVQIAPMSNCPGRSRGSDADVERLLCVADMRGIHMDGDGVWLAIVDTGINLAHLTFREKPIMIDVARSWMKTAGWTPGNAPAGHGTMCAFDAAIAAPKATFLDIQISRPPEFGTFDDRLSDAIRAYSHLCNLMRVSRPFSGRSMVVSNSWGMFHPSWDFPAKDKLGVPNPRNYSDNPGHPFNRIVSALEVLGADILFASGNCGADCPDLRCYGDEKPDPIAATNAIYGANSHPSVLTIAGVDINNTRLGYSTQGPGRLKYEKPDLCGYTHFHGSGVDPIDGGTSAATPVVAGVVAAVRSRRPFQPRNPAASPRAIRNLMRATATDLSPGVEGYDFDHGYGVVGGCALYRKFETPRGIEVNPCLRPDPPWWCDYDICRRYPWLCQNIIQGQRIMGMAETNRLGDNDLEQLLEVLRRAGYHDGQHIRGSGATAAKSGGCSCSDKGSP